MPNIPSTVTKPDENMEYQRSIAVSSESQENAKSKAPLGSIRNPYKLGEKGSGIRLQGAVQDFYELRELHLPPAKPFEDPEFPAEDSSVYVGERPAEFDKEILWKRPGEVSNDPHLFVEGPSRFDVIQGRFGDCWLIAALSNLAMHESLLYQVVPQDQSFQNDYAGIFHFRFWQFGKWIDVVIDDRLPFHNGKLICAHSNSKNEFWPSLVEKAYAKLHGNWNALVGGSSSDAMEDFTGGISQISNMTDAPSDLFDILIEAYENNSLLSCAISEPKKGSTMTKELKEHRLVDKHSYSITKVMYLDGGLFNEAEDIPMIRLRNPWGTEEWKGKWDDDSTRWNSIPEAKKKEIGFVRRDNGEFWMSFYHWKKYFTKYHICYLDQTLLMTRNVDTNDEKSWQLNSFEGEWVSGISAGGRINDIAKFHHNPQYRIALKSESTVIVALMQKNRRTQRQCGKDFIPIGFHIYKLSEKLKSESPKPLDNAFFRYNKPLKISDFTDSDFKGSIREYSTLRQSICRIKLPPGTYFVIPSNERSDKEAEFLLRVFSEKPIKMEEYDVQVGICDAECGTTLKSDPNKELVKLRSIFKKYSGDDWEFNWNELKNTINDKLRKEINEESFDKDAYRSIVTLLDEDNSGKIGLHEFETFWKNAKIWTAAFNRYDKDGTKKLRSFELRDALKSAGYLLNRRILSSVLRRYGTEDRQVKFDNYFMCVIRLNKMIGAHEELASDKLIAADFTLEKWLAMILNFS